MGPVKFGRWVREFAAGVHAGNAIRLGLPVPSAALRAGIVRQRDQVPSRENVVVALDPSRRRRVSTIRARA